MCTTCGCGTDSPRIEGEHHHPEKGHPETGETGDRPRFSYVPRRIDKALSLPEKRGLSPVSPAVSPVSPAHSHVSGISTKRMVRIEQDILSKNNAYAAENRQRLADRGIFALNLVSSPGSGKTTLLVKTIEMLNGRQRVAVVEGDQQTSQDAERIRATGAPAIQINTGKGCHLDAHMVGHAMDKLDLAEDSLLMIENVGNLVCPAAFDLGEAHKVVILSVTEGEDKPIKYPDMFRAATLMLMNKCDLLPYLSFSVPRAVDYARRVNPDIEVIEVSATTGQGMDQWLAWLARGADETRAERLATVDGLKRRVAELEGQLAARSA